MPISSFTVSHKQPLMDITSGCVLGQTRTPDRPVAPSTWWHKRKSLWNTPHPRPRGYKSKCIVRVDQSASDPAEPSKGSKGRDPCLIIIPAAPSRWFISRQRPQRADGWVNFVKPSPSLPPSLSSTCPDVNQCSCCMGSSRRLQPRERERARENERWRSGSICLTLTLPHRTTPSIILINITTTTNTSTAFSSRSQPPPPQKISSGCVSTPGPFWLEQHLELSADSGGLWLQRSSIWSVDLQRAPRCYLLCKQQCSQMGNGWRKSLSQNNHEPIYMWCTYSVLHLTGLDGASCDGSCWRCWACTTWQASILEG